MWVDTSGGIKGGPRIGPLGCYKRRDCSVCKVSCVGFGFFLNILSVILSMPRSRSQVGDWVASMFFFNAGESHIITKLGETIMPWED